MKVLLVSIKEETEKPNEDSENEKEKTEYEEGREKSEAGLEISGGREES